MQTGLLTSKHKFFSLANFKATNSERTPKELRKNSERVPERHTLKATNKELTKSLKQERT